INEQITAKNNLELWEIQAYLTSFIAITDIDETNIELNYKLCLKSIDTLEKYRKIKLENNLLNTAKHNINILKQIKANRAIESKDFLNAFNLMKDLSDYTPQDSTLAINTAFCAEKIQYFNDELTYLIRSTNNGAKNPIIFKKIANLYVSKFDSENALKYLENGLLMNPFSPYLLNDYVNLLLEKERYQKAVELLESYIWQEKNNKSLYYLYGNLRQNYVKDYLKSENAYKMALDLDPYYFDAHYQLGLLYIEKMNDEPKSRSIALLNKAESSLLKAFEISPKDGNTIKLLIEIYTKKQKVDKVNYYTKKLENL
ncbi:MAG: hypothetical protein K2Q03_04060, partial [Sphingobacteriaceae bacterium]|nr:hypothetical protein [Sphingobacteriaceae bacterium]